MSATTYDVTVRLQDAAGIPVAGRDVTATLVDSELAKVDGFVTGDESAIVDRVAGRTNAAGVVVLALVANAEITPANTYYAVRAEGQVSPWLIEATASDDVHALLVTDPDALAPGLLSAHLADTVAAHAASAVSFSPTGTVAATDVQAAIAEVAAEKAFLAHASQHAGAGSDPITSLGAVSFGGGISLTGTSSVADRKITMQSTQMLYYPKDADFPGCVFIGNGGASLAAGAQFNTGLGVNALASLTSGVNNLGLGYSALTALSTGSNNTGVGYAALFGATTNNNTGVGYLAAYHVTTGASNVAVGHSAGAGITTGSGNTVVGASITGLAAASANLTAVGYLSAGSSTGADLTAVGYAAGNGSTGALSTFVGSQAGYLNTGIRNTAVGYNALQGASGNYVTAVGYGAGTSNTSPNCLLLGYGAVATDQYQAVFGSAAVPYYRWIPGQDTDSYLDWSGADALNLQCGGQQPLRMNATGGAPYLGFFGTAPVAKPTGVAVSAAGIHAALVTLGLIAA